MKNYNEKVFKEQVGEYFSLINETPLYKGLEKVLLSKKLLKEVIERNECILEDCEEEGEELENSIVGLTIDSVVELLNIPHPDYIKMILNGIKKKKFGKYLRNSEKQIMLK